MKLAWWPWCPAWCVCPEKGFCSQELIPKEHVTRIIKTCFLIFILIIALSWSIWNFKIIFNSLQKLPQVRNSTLSKKSLMLIYLCTFHCENQPFKYLLSKATFSSSYLRNSLCWNPKTRAWEKGNNGVDSFLYGRSGLQRLGGYPRLDARLISLNHTKSCEEGAIVCLFIFNRGRTWDFWSSCTLTIMIRQKRNSGVRNLPLLWVLIRHAMI